MLMKRNKIHLSILDGGSKINNIDNSQNPSLLGPCPGPLKEFRMRTTIVDPVLTLSKIHLNLVSFQMVFNIPLKLLYKTKFSIFYFKLIFQG